MQISLSTAEKRIAKQLAEIKRKSGSHSPSPAMLANVRGIEVKHDFCFLGNPYATELFLKWWKKDFRGGNKLRSRTALRDSSLPQHQRILVLGRVNR